MAKKKPPEEPKAPDEMVRATSPSHGLLRRVSVVSGAIARGDVPPRHLEVLEALAPVSTCLEEEAAASGDALLADVGAIVSALMVAIARADAKPKKVHGRDIVGPVSMGKGDLAALAKTARRVLSHAGDLQLRPTAGKASDDMVAELVIALRGDGPHEREERELAAVAVRSARAHYGLTYDAKKHRGPMIKAARRALDDAQPASQSKLDAPRAIVAGTLARQTVAILSDGERPKKNVGR